MRLNSCLNSLSTTSTTFVQRHLCIRHFRIAVSSAILFVAAYAGSVNALPVTSKDDDLIVGTENGFSVRTADNQYSFNLNTFIAYDFNYFEGAHARRAPNSAESSEDSFDVREARLILGGHTKNWHYKLSYNFADSGRFLDAYIRYEGFGDWAHLSFGQQKVPLGLDALTSFNEITALERNIVSQLFAHDAFGDSRRAGLSISGHNDRFSYKIGSYEPSDFIDADDEDDLNSLQAMRFTGLPVLTRHGSFHIGLAYQQANVKDVGDATYQLILADVFIDEDGDLATTTTDQRQVSTDTTINIYGGSGASSGPRPIRTEVYDAANIIAPYPVSFDGVNDLLIEMAGTAGPVYMQFEYALRTYENDLERADITFLDVATGVVPPTIPSGVSTSRALDDIEYEAYSAQVAWAITGERRRYDPAQGLYRPIIPQRGLGAWELYFRYSSLEPTADWQDGDATAYNSTDALNQSFDYESFTVGVNWYINRNMRLNLNITDVQYEIFECVILSPVRSVCGESTADNNSGESLGLRFQYSY